MRLVLLTAFPILYFPWHLGWYGNKYFLIVACPRSQGNFMRLLSLMFLQRKFVKVNIAQCEFFEVNLKRMKKTQS